MSLQTLKGFRDILPDEALGRQWVRDQLVGVFERYGLMPIETPTLEYADVLEGKYGEEADKLLYTFVDRGGRKVGLRYDQTIPAARFMAQNRHKLPRYFGRYQIQNVFRADKPQKGRYREFTQCDFDFFGDTSPITDAHMLSCAYDAYHSLGFDDITLRVNDRRLLMDTLNGYSIPSTVLTIVIDKLEKIGVDGVMKELTGRGMKEEEIKDLLTKLKEQAMPQSLRSILEATKALGVPTHALHFTPTLARGLDYYTGIIVEAVLPSDQGLSLGGGGRYDNLIEDIAGYSLSAVGFAVGFDRTVEAAQDRKLIPLSLHPIVMTLQKETVNESLMVASLLRGAGVSVIVYPSCDSLREQVGYARSIGAPLTLFIGTQEQEKKGVTIKNMESGMQEFVIYSQIVPYISVLRE